MVNGVSSMELVFPAYGDGIGNSKEFQVGSEYEIYIKLNHLQVKVSKTLKVATQQFL